MLSVNGWASIMLYNNVYIWRNTVHSFENALCHVFPVYSESLLLDSVPVDKDIHHTL